jgi:hypothetical protein
MNALNNVIREAYRPYMSIIKSIKEKELDSSISHLHSKVIDTANHKILEENDISFSLFALSMFLNAYYGKPCFVFIDEYDLPYDTAYHNGYYEKARSVMSQLFSLLLKV